MIARVQKTGSGVERANSHLRFISFCRIKPFFNLMYFFGSEKTGFGIALKKVRDAGFSWKRRGNTGSGPPLPDPDFRV